MFAARELTRGLGFRTELVHYTTMKIAAFIGPAVISKSSFLNMQPKLSIYRPSIFDGLIYGELSNQRFSFVQLVNIIISFARSSKFTRDQYLQGIQRNRDVKFAGSTLYNLIYRGKLEAKFGNEGALPIQGTVLGFGYVDYRLDDTPEFLMTLGGSKTYKLIDKMRELDMSTIYGPKTLSVLEEMGYSTRRKKQHLDLIPQPD